MFFYKDRIQLCFERKIDKLQKLLIAMQVFQQYFIHADETQFVNEIKKEARREVKKQVTEKEQARLQQIAQIQKLAMSHSQS